MQYLIDLLNERRHKKFAEYEFYEGIINNIKVVVSKTLVGTINATIATIIVITNFNPDIVINQGTAGAHLENLHLGDIVVGEKCCNINSYKTPVKKQRGRF